MTLVSNIVESQEQSAENMKNSKTNLYLFQFSFLYGNEIYLPYSVGALWAYARTFPEINKNIEKKNFVILREQPADIVERLENPGIAAFSTYVWNFEMSVAVARLIKERYPNCLIIFGGPQIPDSIRLEDFFERYPFIDIVVHGEGEITFSEILLAYINGGDFKTIPGLTYHGFTTEIRTRVRDLNIFPSPYLTGVFDELLTLPYHYQTVWETDRGCPYACTFCDWGSMTAQKMFQFDDDRIYKEMELFAEMKISHVYMGNANFGIFPRDVEIARRIAEINEKHSGYPQKIRVNFAKNDAERVFEIAKIFNKQKMDKGITLSVQSMDPETLVTIKRSNLKFDTLSSFVKKYEEEGIDTVVEIIVGLPGETYKTFKDGIESLLDASAHNSLWIYRCTVLPNAPMNYKEYREKHQIKTIRTPIELNHTVPGLDPVQEYEETIWETATLPQADVIRTLVLAWAVQTFHALGLLEAVAIYANKLNNVKYTNFYERLIEYAEQNPKTSLGQEYLAIKEKIENAIKNGGSWESIVPEYNEQTWALEEASYLHFMLQLRTFFSEINGFLDFLQKSEGFTFDLETLSDVLKYQEAVIVRDKNTGVTELKVGSSIHSFFRGAVMGHDEKLQKGNYLIKITDVHDFNGDKNRYATEVVFWGRRGGKSLHQKVEEVSMQPVIKQK